MVFHGFRQPRHPALNPIPALPEPLSLCTPSLLGSRSLLPPPITLKACFPESAVPSWVQAVVNPQESGYCTS